MKAIVLGAAGQLGSELVRILGDEAAVPHGRLSITDAGAVDALIAARRPEVVFNCAAYNAVDRAELEPERALEVNRDGAANVAAACSRNGARCIHFSTNFVFDGALDGPYVESDSPHPLGAYGLSKLAGERRVLAAQPAALVLRTAAVYGRVGTGFPDRVFERARAHGELEMVTDQTVNPTYARDLAARAVELAADRLSGIVHVVGEGCCTWHDFAAAVLRALNVEVPIRRVTSAQLDGRARRPPNGCLESERVEPLRPWQDALADWAREAANP